MYEITEIGAAIIVAGAIGGMIAIVALYARVVFLSDRITATQTRITALQKRNGLT